MTTYDFFPFVKPSNEGKIVFPNYDTIMKREDIVLKPSEPSMASNKEEVNKEQSIDDLAIDFEKLKISRGRQTKNTGGYNHGKLKDLGKELKLRGYKIDFSSKDNLIDSIELLQ